MLARLSFDSASPRTPHKAARRVSPKVRFSPIGDPASSDPAERWSRARIVRGDGPRGGQRQGLPRPAQTAAADLRARPSPTGPSSTTSSAPTRPAHRCAPHHDDDPGRPGAPGDHCGHRHQPPRQESADDLAYRGRDEPFRPAPAPPGDSGGSEGSRRTSRPARSPGAALYGRPAVAGPASVRDLPAHARPDDTVAIGRFLRTVLPPPAPGDRGIPPSTPGRLSPAGGHGTR